LTGCIVIVKHLDGKTLNFITEQGNIISPGMRKQIKGKGMPFYKDSMSSGHLYIDFEIEFPKKGEINKIEELKNILPVPKLPSVEKSKCIVMEQFDKDSMNSKAEGGHSRNGQNEEGDEEDEDGMPSGQRVQCAQQ